MATPATQPETSVMFSLRELRAIEDARRTDEQLARERAIEDARRREEDAAAARRAAEEAAIAARRAADEAALAQAEREAREAALRVREAEARARAAADAELAARRLDEEIALRRAQIMRTRPRALFALLGVFAAAAIALAVLYASRSDAADALDGDLARSRATVAANERRIAALEQARHGNEAVIAGLRAQLHAVGQALLDHPPVAAAIAPPAAHPHGHRGGPISGTPTPPRPPTIDLGDCARQPLLCGK